LREYLRAHPVIAPRREGRGIAVDLPPSVFSQDAVLAGGDLNTSPTTPAGLGLAGTKSTAGAKGD
jgi:hypothetical protein